MQYDVAVIGGGLLGCFTARNLMRYRLSVLLIEKESDVCMGISRANTAVIYSGCDHRPGTLKAGMTVRANRSFDLLCQELGVDFIRCGSLLVSYGNHGNKVIDNKYRQGLANDTDVRILDGAEAEQLEPHLKKGALRALYAPDTGTVNPWRLCIAAYENAVANGLDVLFRHEVTGISPSPSGYEITAGRKAVHARAIVNCGGLHADGIHRMAAPCDVSIRESGADYLILDRYTKNRLSRIVMIEPEDGGKGLTAVPTVEGNILLGPSEREAGRPFACSEHGIKWVEEQAREYLPELELGDRIKSFSAVRPNPEMLSGESIRSFCIEESDGLISLIGIKTPGLTCADELGRYCADKTAFFLKAEINPDFSPRRQAPVCVKALSPEALSDLIAKDSAYGEVICRCGGVTRGEIRDAVFAGGMNPDGLKHRLDVTMGSCQGGRCRGTIERLIDEYKKEKL